MNRNIGKVSTSLRRHIASTASATSVNPSFSDVLPTEIDNHADTHCFGKNFVPFMWTGLVCTVSPFLSEYKSLDDVRICSGATAFTTTDGEVVILIFGQGLWFGDRMEKSLINPNQCRAFGVGVCDDPTDPYREIGFFHDDEFFPLTMKGTTATMETRCPSRQELDECRKFYLSDPDYWDPEDVTFITGREIDTVSTSTSASIMPPYTDLSDKGECRRAISSLSIPTKYKRSSNYPLDISLNDFGGKNILTSDRHHEITPEILSRKWGCGISTARNTLDNTTQLAVRSAVGPLTRRYRTDILQLHYRRLNTRIYTDTMFSKTKSLKSNTCCQIFTDGKGFIWAEPMKSKADAGNALHKFMQDVGIPNELSYDGSQEQCGPGTVFQKAVAAHRIRPHTSEPETPNQNRAEDSIRECKRRWKQRIMKRRVPTRLWDFAIVWEAEILSRMCRHRNNFTGIERITGNTTDISEWLEFEFYDLCWYWDLPNDWDNPKIGRWLGVSHRVGSALCYWILTENAKVVARTTVQHITKEESLDPEKIEKIRAYHDGIEMTMADCHYIDNSPDFASFVNEDLPDPEMGEIYNSNEEPYHGYTLPEIEEIGAMDDAEDAADVYDKYLGVEVALPGTGNAKQMARVVKRIKTGNENTDGNYNPILDTSEYLVEFGDGTTKELTANIIAESMFSQVDAEGHHYQLLDEITEHRKLDTAIPKKDGFYTSRSGQKVPKFTTRGWEFLVSWKDGSSNWIPLKDLKISNPVELADYAVANKIDDQPAFLWWVPYTLRKRERIIQKVKSKY